MTGSHYDSERLRHGSAWQVCWQPEKSSAAKAHVGPQCGSTCAVAAPAAAQLNLLAELWHATMVFCWFSYPTKPNEANIQEAVLVLKNLEDLPSCFDQLSLDLHSPTKKQKQHNQWMPRVTAKRHGQEKWDCWSEMSGAAKKGIQLHFLLKNICELLGLRLCLDGNCSKTPIEYRHFEL